MPRKEPEHPNRGWTIFLLVLVVLALIGAGLYFWPKPKPRKAETAPPDVETPTKAPEKTRGVRQPVPEQPQKNVVDLDNLDRDEKLGARNRDRKEKYGVDESVDAIVHSDESLKIGDSIVPMEEILEKIRIKSGELSEDTLTEKKAPRTPEERKNRIDRKMEEVKDRIAELEKILEGPGAHEGLGAPAGPGTSEGPDAPAGDGASEGLGASEGPGAPGGQVSRKRYAKELEDLRELEEIYNEYLSVYDQLEKDAEAGGLVKLEAEKLSRLENLRDDLVRRLEESLGLEEKPDVFGIHKVRKNENIWNIHFAFLKEYFESKGIEISASADEPDRRGFSSGVGKLLKFSEKIVYIYNLRDRKLDVDLDLINPESKIVVFRMDEIFEFLDELELDTVDRIRFDGENIWIKADS